MTELPFEILRLISQSLEYRELLQFQLVNKRWHEASSESLYAHVSILVDHEALSYIRTISNSLKFGLYLKTFRAASMFSASRDSIIWDKNNLFSALVKYCVNLQSLSAFSPPPMLWTRLILAANQGQLPNLQRLPDVKDDCIESYVCAALAFKKSLKSLGLVDHVYECYRKNYKKNTVFFQELLDHIKEFPNLKDLSIIRCTNQPFSHIIDSIIDDCPHLMELNVALHQSDLQASITQNVLAIPKPNIIKLTCHWIRIYKDDQLKYIMRKFPKLQQLYIMRRYTSGSDDENGQAYETSYDVMMEFIKYISSIKTLDFNFFCKRKDITNYWSEFCKLRKPEASKNVYINYYKFANDSIVSAIYTERKFDLTYVINSSTNVIPHEEFLSEHGDAIKTLSIDSTFTVYENLDKTSSIRYLLSNENWIYQILQSCPSLHELELIDLVDIKLPGHSIYQHTALQKLKITDDENITSLKFLKNLSFHVPNLKELEIHSCQEIEDKNGYHIEIDMPYTTFDTVKMRFVETFNNMEAYYLKLNTFVDENYYYFNSTGKHSLTYNAFLKSKKNCLYEITCRGLKKFDLERSDIIGSFKYNSTHTF